jgi:hypothetical protein
MELQHIEKLMQSVACFDASWWKDDRRYWCAYCGIPTRRRSGQGSPQPLTLGTRDHVIPKAHRGGHLTIPACRECNIAKGKMSLPEYLDSEHFKARRKNKHKHQWPLHLLWAVTGVAALKCSSVLLAKSALPGPDKTACPTSTTDRIR